MSLQCGGTGCVSGHEHKKADQLNERMKSTVMLRQPGSELRRRCM